MKENRTIESYVAQAIGDALRLKTIKYRSGEYISERYYRKIMFEINNCNAKEVSRISAYMQINSMIRRIADFSTGGQRTLTSDEEWLVDRTINELMNMFTGYTIAAE